jgi:site-specific recombinase XerD
MIKMNIEDAIEDFINYCIFEKGLSETTKKSYQNDLKVIWISEKPLDSTSIKANSSTELYITTTSDLYNTLITK